MGRNDLQRSATIPAPEVDELEQAKYIPPTVSRHGLLDATAAVSQLWITTKPVVRFGTCSKDKNPVAVWSGQTLSNMRLHPPLEKRCYRIVSSRNHALWHGPDPPIGCEFVPRNLQIRPLTQIQRTCVGIGMKMYEVNIAKQVSHLPYKDRQG